MGRLVATLFDFDGVLVDSEPVHLAAFNDVLAPLGIVVDEATYLTSYLSLDDAGVFRAALGSAGLAVDAERVQALVEAKSPRFLERFESAFRVYPGGAELLRRRAMRGPVGIVSGALEREIAFALDRMGVRSAVSFVVSADRPVPSKPDPAPYRLAVDELRSRGLFMDAVAVEDSLGGVASAKGAGVRCVAVAHSYSAEALREAGADAVVPDLASLTDGLLEEGA